MRKVKILFFCLALVSAVLVLSINLINTPPSAKEIANTLSKNTQRELLLMDEEASRLLKQHDDDNWEKLNHSFYLIKENNVQRWNQNEFLPEMQWLEEDFSVKFLKQSPGDFLVKKWPLSKTEFLVAVLPLHVDYKISNRYLGPNWNQRIFSSAANVIIMDSNSAQGEPVMVNGKDLFHITQLSTKLENDSLQNISSVILACISILCALAWFFCWAIEFHRRRKYERAWLTLMTGMVSVRVVMLVLNIPQIFTNSSVFDPVSFASSVYNPSLGDLLLNSLVVLVLVVYLFLFYARFNTISRIQNGSHQMKFAFSAFFLLAAIFSFLFPFLYIETISNNSSIALDITQSLSFDMLRLLAYFSLLIGGIAGFLGAHVFFRISISLIDSRTRFFLAYGLALLLFCIYFLSAGRDYWITVFASTGYFIILFFAKLYKDASRLTFRSSFYFFLIALAFSVQTSFSLKRFVEERQREAQLRFGYNFLVDRDILGEYLLHESSMQIANDPLVQSRLANPFLGRAIIRDKIKQIFLSSYFDRYDVQIYLYDSRGEPMDNLSAKDIVTYINTLPTASKTEYKELYFIKDDALQSTKRYLAVTQVNDHNAVAGFVVLDLSLKRIVPQHVYPELLLDNRFSQYAQSRDFSYAFFSQQKILSSFGNFNYEKDFHVQLLDQTGLYSSGAYEGGFIHVGIDDDAGRTAVISAPAYSWFFLLTNIAFFFILGLLLLFFLLSFYGVAALIKKEQLNYSARIQLYIHMAFLIPLILVSITTLSLTARSAQEQLNETFSEKSKLLGERIATSLENMQRDSVSQNREVENLLGDLSRLMNVDAALYDTAGYLIASTQPLITENQLMTRLINRDAWTKIVRDKERDYISNERIGLLRYNASYVAVKSPQSGKLAGIISLPFFDSASSLERNQTIVFANIIDIFFVVFVLFSFLSFFAADELTFPLRFITRTLRRTTLVGDNKPLTWKANDEIGMMVNEYNRMVENLETSKIELARSQKESAWREIAKQVAHEINNPLTPMKLTLQQMDRNLASGELTTEKTSQSIRTLLEQVDILNEIAASFSAFARMPAPLLHRIELTGLLRKVVELHRNEKLGDITITIEDEPVYAMGDAQLLSRVFSNLILNALQSGKDGMPVQLKVTAKADENMCLISFRDTGMGISKELRDKIFLPHFTTKKTGSGIGLAIARQGIEQSGGEIWFESVEGVGTTFYIRLPRVK
jgi:two-component system nitrogen regulation sensor histidine kinase NtrY